MCNGIISVGEICNFLGSVLLQQKFEAMDGLVLQLSFIWQVKENHPRGVRAGQPRRCEEKREAHGSILVPLFMLFLLPLSLPYVNWASQESCLFHLSFSLRSSDLPLFYFCGLFPSLSFSHHYSGPLFWILTT